MRRFWCEGSRSRTRPGEPRSRGAGLSPTARYRYQEWYRRDSVHWLLDAYAYDYVDLVHRGGIGFHWHPIRRIDPSGGSVYHVKCVDPRVPARDPHFRGHRMTLIEARDAFTRIDAVGQTISCDGLYPLANDPR